MSRRMLLMALLLALAVPAWAQPPVGPSSANSNGDGPNGAFDGNLSTYWQPGDPDNAQLTYRWSASEHYAVTSVRVRYLPDTSYPGYIWRAQSVEIRCSTGVATYTTFGTLGNAVDVTVNGSATCAWLTLVFARQETPYDTYSHIAVAEVTITATPGGGSPPPRQPPPPATGCVPLTPIAPTGIIAHGDSITEGTVGTTLPYPSLLHVWQLVPVTNAGVNGDGTPEMLARMGSVLAATGDVVILYGGTNDVQREIAASASVANLSQMVTQTRAAGKTPVLVGPIARNNVSHAGLLALRSALATYAAGACVPFVDLWTTFDGGGGQVAPGLSTDGVHPNTRGAYILARGIARALGWGFLGD